MAKQDISKLKDWFKAGNYPTQEQFWDWMDSYIHKDDRLGIAANFPELDGILQQKAEKEALKYHLENDQNPHGVSKQQVGLGSVDNTADVDKPVSKATGAALDLKGDKSAFDGHVNDQTNPHQVTKAQIGLGNADNTTDLDKPISILTQTALNLKAEKVHTHNANALIGFDTDITLAANSDEKVASQKAVKTYVDNQIKSLGNHSSELLVDTATMDKPLTNLLIPSAAEPINATDKLIEALGKLQGQVNALSRFNKRVFVQPTRLRNEFSNVSANASKRIETSTINPGSFSNQNGINKLTLIINLLNSATPTVNTDFERKHEFYLSLKNGKLSTMYSDINPYTDIKIGEIVHSKGHGNGSGMKIIELYFKTSMQDNPLSSIQWSMLEFIPFQVQNNTRTEGIPVSAYLRDIDNTRIVGASECLFTILVKSSILFKKDTHPTIADAIIDISGVILDQIK